MSQKRYLNPHEIHRPQLPTLRERKQMRKNGISIAPPHQSPASTTTSSNKSIVKQFVNQNKKAVTQQPSTTTDSKGKKIIKVD